MLSCCDYSTVSPWIQQANSFLVSHPKILINPQHPSRPSECYYNTHSSQDRIISAVVSLCSLSIASVFEGGRAGTRETQTHSNTIHKYTRQSLGDLHSSGIAAFCSWLLNSFHVVCISDDGTTCALNVDTAFWIIWYYAKNIYQRKEAKVSIKLVRNLSSLRLW